MAITLPQRDPCPFCENVAGRHPCAFVMQDELISSFVNPRQYARGALLIIPNRHAPTLLDLRREELAAIFAHAQDLIRAVEKAFAADGYNVFQNNGIVAGQSVPHYHLHIVPRYVNETSVEAAFSEQAVQKMPFDLRLEIAEAIKQYLPR